MDKFIEMDYEDFIQTYKPIINHLDNNASFDGYMFETYGEEVEFVKSQDPAKIWMYGDGDGGSYIWSGWGFVNYVINSFESASISFAWCCHRDR